MPIKVGHGVLTTIDVLWAWHWHWLLCSQLSQLTIVVVVLTPVWAH